MNKFTQDDDISQTERQLTSPPSPKRPRVDCTVMNDHSGLSRFDFPEFMIFRKNSSSPTSANTLEENEGRICTVECLEDGKSQEQPQDTKFNVTPTTELTLYNKSTHMGSSKVCVVPAESEKQPLVTERDKLSFYQSDDTNGSLGESDTLASANTSSLSDGRLLGASLRDEIPAGCSPSTGNEKDGRQVQKNASEMQTVNLTSRNEEVICQPNCTYKETVCDIGFCNTRSQFAEVVETNQKRAESEFNENIVFTKEEGTISASDYADSKLLYSNPEEDPSGNLEEVVKKGKNDLELQFCRNENGSVCGAETEGQVNDNDMWEALTPSAGKRGERSILSHDAVLERNVAIENMNLKVDDLCEAKREDGACRIIAKARSETANHTTETSMPAGINQEPAEGDNDDGPFCVIGPAICSETDREAEENCCNSASAAGTKLSPAVEVCEMETPLPLSSDMRPSQKVSSPEQAEHFIYQSRTWHQEGENDVFCLPRPQSYSITSNGTHGKTFNEGICHWKSSSSGSPTKPLPPGDDESQESHGSMGHELKEQSRSSCFSVRLDHLEMQEVKPSQGKIDSVNATAEVKEGKESLSFVKELESDEHVNLKKTVELEQKPLLKNEQHNDDTTESPTCECNTDWTEGETHERDSGLKLTEGEQGNKLDGLSDQPFSADISIADVEEEERKDVSKVGDKMKTDGPEKSEILVQSVDYVQQQNEHKADMTEVSSGEGTGEWREWRKSPLGSEDGQEHKLSCFSDCQDKAENKADFLAFSFSSTSDAVVPCQGNLSHSHEAHSNPTALNCSDRFSPLPSAFTLYNRVLEGFDTFEKIQLSPDEDDTAGGGNIPVLISLPGQLLETPELLLYHFTSVAESDMHEEIPEEEKEEEEEVEGSECHTENMANGFLSSHSACNEVPNFISAADAIALEWPERQPNCELVRESCEQIQDELNPELVSSTVSAESDSSASGANGCAEFEMKKQFDLVLKELNLFFEISRNDYENDCGPNSISPEQCSDKAKALEGNTSEYTEHLTSSDVGRHRDTPLDDADEDRSLDICVGDPVVFRTAVSSDGEQEVPLSRHLCQEASVESAEKHREPQEMEQKGRVWSPSFMCLPLLEQLSHKPPEQPRRLEPLKTCARPIRVGLSKRAKTKHLHRPHPYK